MLELKKDASEFGNCFVSGAIVTLPVMSDFSALLFTPGGSPGGSCLGGQERIMLRTDPPGD